MGFTEVLTIIFVVLKVLGYIDWSWLIVFLPEIIAGIFYITYFIAIFVRIRKINKKIDDIWR